jgi:hypothetical protein
VITIKGVGVKHSGNYYVFHVEHVLTMDGGYICNLKVYKNATNKLPSDLPDKIDADKLGNFKNKVQALPDEGTSDLKSIPITEDQ